MSIRFFFVVQMRSSGIKKIPNRLENTATNSQSYQASSITCDNNTIQISG